MGESEKRDERIDPNIEGGTVDYRFPLDVSSSVAGVTVTTKKGCRFNFRMRQPTDEKLINDFLDGLSAETVGLIFKDGNIPGYVRTRFTSPQSKPPVALAIERDESGEKVAGLCGYQDAFDKKYPDAYFIVSQERRNQGIGAVFGDWLVDELRGKAEGFTMTIRYDNKQMHALLRKIRQRHGMEYSLIDRTYGWQRLRLMYPR